MKSDLTLTGTARYESLWNELSDFLERSIGTVDEKALRITLAIFWIHLFTKDAPVSVWMQDCPLWLSKSLRNNFTKAILTPAAGVVAKSAMGQTSASQSFWVIRNADAVFDGKQQRVLRTLETLSAVSRGELAWGPISVDLDRMYVPAFSWEGRATIALTSNVPLNAQQAKLCRLFWPTAQNDFTVVRFEDREGNLSRKLRREINSYAVLPVVAQMLINLIDYDSRGKTERSRESVGLFDPISSLAVIAKALRGSGFNSDALAARAIRIGRGHADFMGKEVADAEDLGLSRKVMLDAISRRHLEVIRLLPLEGFWTAPQVEKKSGVDRKRVQDVIDVLLPAKVLTREAARGGKSYWYSVSPELQRALLSGV